MAGEKIGPVIAITGEAEFKNSMKSIANEFKLLDSQMKLAVSQFEKNDKSTEALTAKNQVLGKQIDTQKTKISTLTTQYGKQNDALKDLEKKLEASKEAFGADSAEVAKAQKAYETQANRVKTLEAELNKASAALNKMDGELDENTKNISIQSNEWTKLGKELEGISGKMKSVGDGITGVGKNLSIGITAPLLGVGAAAISVGNEFESAMSRVKAISGATGEEFTKLKDQALQLGADTAFSATQAAEGMENLASAGFNVVETTAAMPGLLDLAASGNLAVAQAADITGSALRGFNIEADKAGHVSDVLAKAAADTNAGVEDMGEALKYAAPPANALGLSLEEVAAAVGLMSNAGIKGGQAGTTLRGSLISLASPSKEAAGWMESLGFNAFDAEGKLLPFKDVISELQNSTEGLSEEIKANALATIFGKEALSGIMVLMDAGPEKFDALTKGFENADGAAKAMADTMLDNTKADIDSMMGSLETAGIKIQTAVAPTLRDLAGEVQELANAFSGLSPEMQGTIIKVGLTAAAVGPLLVLTGTLVSSVGAIAGAFGAASLAMGAGAATAGVATPAVAGLGAAFGAAVIPAIPLIAGVGAVVVAGLALKTALEQEVIPEVDLFADKVTQTAGAVESGNGRMSESITTTSTAISEGTKKAVGAYIELDDGAAKSLTSLFVNSTAITGQIKDSTVAQYTEMARLVKEGLDKRYAEELATMQKFFDQSSALSATEEQKALDAMKTDNEKRKEEEDKALAAIAQIMQTASDNNRALTAEEEREITTIREKMKTNAIKVLSESEVESKIILERIKEYGVRISTEQASEIIKAANVQKDGTIKAANEEYDSKIASIIKMRDESHAITSAQADLLIGDAQKQKNETILAAEAMKTQAVSKVVEMNAGIKESVDLNTGNILTAWDSLKSWWNNWNPQDKTLSVTTTARNRIDGYAAGTTSASPGIHWVGENGPELVNFSGGESVLNARDSARVGAGSVTNYFDVSGMSVRNDNDIKLIARELFNLQKQTGRGLGYAR